MKSRRTFKKRNNDFRKESEELRLKPRKKEPKKMNKHQFYSLLEEEGFEDEFPINKKVKNK